MTSLTPLRDATDIAAHGGKAFQLARLITAGLPIPDGFVIPRDLAPHQLPPAADTLLAWAAHARTPYGLIVRSSSPVEDGPQASFAGLYASRFTVTEAPALLDAITLVRNSGARATIRAYADAHRIQVPSQIAAIVQPAIRPYSSGVLTGQLRDDTWATWQIEAVHGLADALVSGHISGELHHPGQPPTPAAQTDMVLPARPAELRLPPGEWITVDDHEGRAGHAKIRTSAGGLITVLRPPAWTTRPILSPTDRDRLLELAAASAAIIGVTSIDLEWAISPDGKLHLLQTRPLTRTLPPPRSALQPGADARSWQGIPASPGYASGPSLNLATASGSATGTVLVCGNIGPDAAAVLLQRPAGIAATTGGPLSHAAIVARELAIPCVTALPKHLLTLPDDTPPASCLSRNVQNPPHDISTRTGHDHPVPIHPAIGQIPTLRNRRQRERYLQDRKIIGQIRETNIVVTTHLQDVTALPDRRPRHDRTAQRPEPGRLAPHPTT